MYREREQFSESDNIEKLEEEFEESILEKIYKFFMKFLFCYE